MLLSTVADQQILAGAAATLSWQPVDSDGEHDDTPLREAFEKFADWVEPHVETATRTRGVERAVMPPPTIR